MLKIYNTLTQQKEIFQSILPKKINIYVCGVTVYDFCHLGHARCYTAFDVILRYLRRDYEVTYVRNITDIDDKIIKRANDNQEDYQEVVKRFTQAMHEDFSALGLMTPDHEPRATHYIPDMIKLIEKMIANESAYVGANHDVYFDVRHFKEYGCLSHHNIEQLESGARVDVSDIKRDPLDFVLWKSAKPSEPAWDSPWGKGRPGWHIECSAMSMDLLGEHFDIHGGGRDLIFPHHENEIAQSEAVSQKKFVNIWMHNGYLQIDKQKMSKSLGNFLTIRDVLKVYSSEVIRYFLIASHYRSPLIYSDDVLQQAKQSLTRLYTALRQLPTTENVYFDSPFEERFLAAMDDDFNTPIALSVLFDLAHEIHRLKENDIAHAANHGALLKKLAAYLGILTNDPEHFFRAGKEIDIAKVEALISARNEARAQKNWAEADRVRQELEALAIVVEDGPEGTFWKKSLIHFIKRE